MPALYELMDGSRLNQSAWECTRQSRWKDTTQRYLANMLLENMALKEEVMEHRYSVRPTTDFMLNERGRIRKIEAPNVRDRVVQKPIVKDVLIPSLVPYLIYDNYASLARRGTSMARRRFEIMLRKYINRYGTDGYILLIDISKYFENIDHEVLKQLIGPRLADEPVDVVGLVHYIIDTSSKTSKGLNLGSEAPQILAVYYLNLIDTFVKIVKSVKFYGRYMDDMFIICRTKQEARDLLDEISAQMEYLVLNINEKKTQIVKLSHGFTYLQVKYIIKASGKIKKCVTPGKVIRERRRLKGFKRQYNAGLMTETEIYNCYQSWRGTIVKDYNACKHTLQRMDALYVSLFPEHQPYIRRGRKAIVVEINSSAETQDLRFIV